MDASIYQNKVMTIKVGINLGEYAILAADTRVSFISGDYLLSFRDDAEKIQKTKIGLITGAGYVDLLNDVKDYLSINEITHTSEIEEAIRKFRGKYTLECNLNSHINGRSKKSFESTGWIYTYSTPFEDCTILL